MLPKFYFINLDRSEDRLKHMNKFFRKLEKKTELKPRFERISAFDGKNENVDNFSNLKLENMWLNKEQNRKAIGPEFGCCYSHVKAMKVFLDDKTNEDEIAFMCEDDLELFKIDKDFFKKMISEIVIKTKENGILSISCVGSPLIIEPLHEKINSPIYLDYHSNIGKLYGTGCYAINRKTAQQIVNKHWKNEKLIIDEHHNSMVADHFIYPRGDKTCFVIPSLFTLRPQNDSYIHKEHLDMHDKVQISMFKMWSKFNIAKSSDFSIISNNEWGNDYYVQKTIKFNTPTVTTQFSPEDYVTFIENFEVMIKEEIKEEKTEEKFPIGKIEANGKKVLVNFVNEKDWSDSFKHWEERKKLLPKKSEILFKICDNNKFGTLTKEHLDRFYKCNLSKKVVFLSDYCSFKDKFSAKIIPSEFCNSEKKCCPEGNKLYKICGIN